MYIGIYITHLTFFISKIDREDEKFVAYILNIKYRSR